MSSAHVDELDVNLSCFRKVVQQSLKFERNESPGFALNSAQTNDKQNSLIFFNWPKIG